MEFLFARKEMTRTLKYIFSKAKQLVEVPIKLDCKLDVIRKHKFLQNDNIKRKIL